MVIAFLCNSGVKFLNKKTELPKTFYQIRSVIEKKHFAVFVSGVRASREPTL